MLSVRFLKVSVGLFAFQVAGMRDRRSATDNSSDDSDGTEQAKAGPDKKGGGMLAARRQIEMGTR